MTNAKILIVEDEYVIRESLEITLKERGYSIEGGASSGEEAIQKALKVRPDLVLMDIVLEGDMDGVEAAKQIHEVLGIPIIFLTGYADPKLLERAKITDPYGYILKPFTAKELHVTIEMALYKHKTERKLKELNEILEQRIVERTAELEMVNGELIRENEERRLVERTLRESEEKFRKISDTANDAIIMLDNDGKISYWNKSAEKIFGYSRDETVGEKISKLIIPEKFREKHLEGFERFKETGVGILIGKAVEVAAIRRDGSEIPIELSLSAVKIDDKWNAIGIVRDIIERKQMEKEFMKLQKMASIKRLTSGLFHEILNPLNIISSHVQLLLMDVDNGSMAEKDLNSIREEICRIEKLTKDLMVFTEEEEFVTDEVQINSLLENITSSVESDMKSRKIKLIKRFEEGLPGIMVNSDKLRDVFLDLITNACNAMPEGGTVTISTQGQEHGGRPLVRIKFTDTGCGIEKENIDKLFEIFFSTKKEVTGVGLGLSESYEIIKSHGGTISVESEAGKGATVTIDLPIERKKKRVSVD
ncbi:MAG: PAS domain S-box protein [Candidatus Scalindua rubra]|uniref:histidine kinase n=1 Tax=Candidatus Scalindua brodae TaxID=237368 RepID=A0A0B0ENC1_9BACT|nr:MAG: two-component sensor kinase [Candidatus Scalindua brodae]MBZ0109894.1 PAS domain S-box protein [Candidatus Scalindua rubra]